MISKTNPDHLQLNASPPYRAVRFKKGLVIGVVVLGIVVIFGLTALSLRKPDFRGALEEKNLYKAQSKQEPNALAALPKDYSQVKEKPIKLGPPLPGDLGRPILAYQKAQGGVSQGKPLSQQLLHTRQAGVFFHIENKSSQKVHDAKTYGALSQQKQAEQSSLSSAFADDQNNQQRKQDFVDLKDDEGIYNAASLQMPASPYQLMAGSIIAASLITGINSDLPGFVIAQITENIYDSISGQTLLIPQGSRLIGSYDSVVAFGQSRALLVWKRIVMPNGNSIQLDNLPATDEAGYAGLEDEVDYHTWTLLKGIALSTFLNVGTELSFTGESDLVSAVRESSQRDMSQAGQRITEKNLNIQPTITIRPGWPLRVIVHKDLIFKPYQRS